MIIGEFGLMGRPFVEGYLRIPRFNLTANITFLVDTGADVTCIHPREPTRRHPFQLAAPQCHISRHRWPGDPINTIYSLLGRDIIDRWHMVYDRTAGRLEFTVKETDFAL